MATVPVHRHRQTNSSPLQLAGTARSKLRQPWSSVSFMDSSRPRALMDVRSREEALVWSVEHGGRPIAPRGRQGEVSEIHAGSRSSDAFQRQPQRRKAQAASSCAFRMIS